MLLRRSPIVLAFLAGTCTVHADPAMDWFSKQLFKRINITGTRTFGYHAQTVTGDTQTYNSLTNYGLGGRRYTDTGQMMIRGDKVFGVLNFEMSLVEDRYADPQSKRISLNYAKNGLNLDLGDINGHLLNTNQFATFQKSLYGAGIGYNKGRFAVAAVRSESKGTARTISVAGNGSTGPYYLQSSQIVNGSEEVRVDGVTQKPGQDYTIDYQLGAINFVTKTISPTSTIVISYEALSIGGTSGLIQGMGTSYNMGRFGKIGLVTMAQTGSGASGSGTIDYTSFGFGAGNPPYNLQYAAIPESMQITVDGIPQVLAIKDGSGNLIGDYYFDPGTTATVYFTRPIPFESIIVFKYRPKAVTSSNGDRRVWGFDYSLPINGKNGYITYSRASGQMTSGLNQSSGMAQGIRSEYAFKNLKVGKTPGTLKLRAGVWDIPKGYVGVETRGFNRNERATDVGLDWTGGPYSFGVTHTNSNILVQTLSSNQIASYSRARNSVTKAVATYRPDDGLTWSLQQTRQSSRSIGTESDLNSTALSTSKRIGKLNARFELERQEGRGPIQDGNTSKIGTLNLNTLRLSGDYLIRDGWTFGGRVSASQVKALEKSGTGQDYSFTSAYHPSGSRIGIDASYSVSNSGELAAVSGFQGGYGYGYGGNGFSNGSGTNSFGSGGSDYRLLSLASTYDVNSRMHFDSRFYKAYSSGSFNSNSDTTSYGTSLNWDIGKGNSISAGINQSATEYLGAGIKSDSLSWDFSIGGRPTGSRWTYQVGATGLAAGGTQYGQDSFGFNAFLRYQLNPHQALRFETSLGRSSGYLPQNETYAGLFYEYQIYKNIALVGSYQFRNVKNLTDLSTGAYRSKGFDLELTFNFGQ